jgi:hypothetical protein
MTRIRQFAKDMGISYNKANSLVQKGRKKRDGGSTVLENTMNNAKMMKAANGKITKLRKKTSNKAKMGNFKNIVNASVSGKITPEEAEKRIKKIILSKKDGGGFPDLSGDGKTTMKDILIGRGVIKKKMGGIARGGGAATSGTGFKGVY